jgi:fluoride exporter
MVQEWVAIAIGGMLGTLMRHTVASLFAIAGAAWLPGATLVVNVCGCFAIGYISAWAVENQMETHWIVTAVRVGLLGGLTTFSSFGMDIIRLWQNGRQDLAGCLVMAHLGLGLAAVVLGLRFVGK